MLNKNNHIYRYGIDASLPLLKIDHEKIKAFKVYLSYIVYVTMKNEVVVIDSETGFEYWRKKNCLC